MIGTAHDIFRITMLIRWFYFLLRHLRFDDMTTRTERPSYDNMAAMRNIFEVFVTNCQKHYQIGEYVTSDDKLESLRAWCQFQLYMDNKHAKYDIKIYALIITQQMLWWNDYPKKPSKLAAISLRITFLFFRNFQNIKNQMKPSSFTFSKFNDQMKLSSMFGFGNKKVLLSYVSNKKQVNVLNY